MCRDGARCDYISDSANLVDSLARRPTEFDGMLSDFVSNAITAKNSDSSSGSPLLNHAHERELNAWFCDHAQFAYKFRANRAKHEKQLNVKTDSKRLSAADIRKANRRDNYRCRYCEQPVLPVEFFRKFSKLVGPEEFQFKGKNAEIHGIRLVFGATADHVVPWADGGPTSSSNLVTACWPCNFGKYDFSLEELGMTDPRDRLVLTLDNRVHSLLESFGLLRLVE